MVSKSRKYRLDNLTDASNVYERGTLNSITDVPGVLVGHATIIEGKGKLRPGTGPIRTGVTVLLPHSSNIFEEKVWGGSFVMNGYGKTIGLVQLTELGLIETPIALTNTLNVPTVADGLVDYSIENNPEIGIKQSSVNPIVGECNDSYLNDIQGRHVKKDHVLAAISKATKTFEEGSVGAGTGMRALGYKSGIGTASRVIGDFNVGVMVVPNFGKKSNLMIKGKKVDPKPRTNEPNEAEDGSIMVILALDAPLTNRQLHRLCKRAPLGIARVGGFASHGSGDVIIAFSTINKMENSKTTPMKEIKIINEYHSVFSNLLEAVVEATEEAILNALLAADTMVGRDNNKVDAINPDIVKTIIEDYQRGKTA